ncbi:hypothetical protein J7399_06170 [Shimia sp. R9_1]|uniref:hypothetical protein n=1 Tax=unclassified Shimia TaxID=2630038 RepID=UPI001ADD3656|nr:MULTISPECIES: hypothetical protein [unclassified Shimia]MBO9397942.1 hypothetical protein [Shimia sp. R9_2]MBO9400993.1 hypothetical protein [Shimia sp. R9_3]MBO9407005.1 hypothetical protein [Shimia sp. R9_1]
MTSKTFIAAVLSAALVITGLSAPRAHALDEDAIGALLFGGLALAVIGAAVADHKDDKKEKPRYTYQPSKPEQPKKPKKAKKAKHKHKSWLPSHCSKRFETHRGKVIQAYGQRCLFRAEYPAYRLPEKCYFQARGKHRTISGYRTNCLDRNGYQVVWR